MSTKPKTFFESELERIYSEHTPQPEHFSQVRRSKAFMEKFYASRIELDDLAKAAHMSRFHYIRIFRKMYGLTPRNYLRDLRISKAKQLICSDVPITQVCLEVGYESLPTFSSAFKKCTGYTPRAYQKIQKSNLE